MSPSDAVSSTARCSTSSLPASWPRSSTSTRLAGSRSWCPTFAFNLPGRSSEDVAYELAAREIAVWHGDYYAVEIMKLLGLEGTGAVRAGIVHYNTEDEVDRLLSALDELC